MIVNLLLFTALAFQAPADDHVDLMGCVTGTDGRPLNEATVCILSAKDRVGVNYTCPTCYRDCTKHSVTGPDGNFTIADVSPNLVFQMLVVADGFKPALVDNVDPRAISLGVRLEVNDPKRLQAGHVLQGRVLDPEGKPVAGALVSPFGIKNSKSRSWGKIPGVDRLAVTNLQGEFQVHSDDTDISLDLRIEAPGLATVDTEPLAVQAEAHTIRMVYGVSVTGKVLNKGKPVVGVVVGLVQANRSPPHFRRALEVRTDEKGRFHFWNVCTKEEYYLYGKMEDSTLVNGALPITKLTTKAEGEELRSVELAVVPSYRITGRVIMADGKAGVPTGLKLAINRNEAWDGQAVEVDRNGGFTFLGVPAEQIQVQIVNRDFHFAADNKSLDPYRPRTLVGRVANDITGFCIRVEPGVADMIDPRRLTSEELARLQEQLLRAKAGSLSGVAAPEK